jgi:DinB superfamily
MTHFTPATTTTASELGNGLLSRILKEGYGTGAWHGPDLAAALSDVTSETVLQRPAPGRHNIAEIALHHAWSIRSVTGQLTGQNPDAFPLQGEDWFEVDDAAGPTWDEVRAILAGHQERLAQAVAGVDSGRIPSPLSQSERLGLVLGITCHAVYHAGQIQLVKRLLAG